MVIFFFVAEIAQKTPENPYYDWVFNHKEKDTKKPKKIPFGIFLRRKHNQTLHRNRSTSREPTIKN